MKRSSLNDLTSIAALRHKYRNGTWKVTLLLAGHCVCVVDGVEERAFGA